MTLITLIDVPDKALILQGSRTIYMKSTHECITDTMFAVIDILVAELEGQDLEDIAARRQVSYETGFKGSSFWDSFEGETKSRRQVEW